MADKLYYVHKHGDLMGTFSSFEEAVGMGYGWDMPTIVCKTGDEVMFRVVKEVGRWVQKYPDGRERDVTDRMATIAKLAEKSERRPKRAMA